MAAQDAKKEKNAKVIAFYNRKGGVGKSTLSINLAGFLSKKAQTRVMYIDLDSQCDTSIVYLGKEEEFFEQEPSSYHSLLNLIGVEAMDVPKLSWKELRVKAENYNFYTIYPHFNLSEYWDMSDDAPNSINVVNKFIEEIRSQFDYIILNMGPDTSNLTYSFLCASDYAIIPVEAMPEALVGAKRFVKDFLPNIKKVNSSFKCLGLVFNKVKDKSHFNFINSKGAEFSREFGIKIFDAVIPNCAALSKGESEEYIEELASRGPVLFYNPDMKRRYRNYYESMRSFVNEIFDDIAK